jgi:glycerol-3-phosphate acyltransferase PlsY
MIQALVSVIIAYLLGSIPFGYIIVKTVLGKDVRETGSRSIGATNVLRSAGKAGGILTFVCDVGKGFAAVWVSRLLTANHPWAIDTAWVIAACALAAILGHIFPVFLNFKGGKGVATGVGVFLAIYPWAVASVVVIFAIVVYGSRYISLGSIIATAAFPVFAYFLGRDKLPLPVLLASVVGAALIVAKHHENIQRLMLGTENKFTGFSKKSA